jgi:glycosyltransferase involved in cell wall biosynthesis
MNNYDLSILIPARNEMFVAKTVERLLVNIRGNTEILVGLDGQWANPPIQDDDRVTVVFFPESLGQRAATNQLCRLSKAKYVMKLDAHCEMDEGFDVKLMADMQDDWTVLPTMRNLHAFDWVCVGNTPKSNALYLEEAAIDKGCGWSKYQGPTPENGCPQCNGNVERLLKWIPKESPKSRSFRFDKTMHFQYFNEYMKRPEVRAMGDLTPSLSAQGSCFFLTRQKYWDLDICDESHGSWGQQGVEVALKTWESGGKLVVNNKTWYAHMFRTQGGDFGFPYPLSGNQVEKAREFSRDLWMNNKWPKAILTLQQVLDKFKPVPDWHTDNAVNIENAAETEAPVESASGQPSKGIIFYTDNKLNLRIAHAVQDQLSVISFNNKIPIISASLKPMPHFGKNIHLPLERGIETYFTQIVAALEELDTDIVYFCEHDVLYHQSHFDFTPERQDIFYYNQNFWRIRSDGFAVHWDANQVSGLVCNRQLALNYYTNRLIEVRQGNFNRSYEPGGRDPNKYVVFKSEYPNIDVRHEGTLTKSKWSPNDFRDKSTCVNWQESTIDQIPGWKASDLSKLFA